MIKVLMFVGNEAVSPHNIVEVESFSKEALIPAIMEYYGKPDSWLKEEVIWLGIQPYRIEDSFEIMGENLAQIVDDEGDGGMIYVVRQNGG